jgi:pimeloyl-ACP methyl ester carboxylesterase
MSADYDLVRTQKVAVKGTAFSYRRFGAESAVPLILLTHFRASMDNWDPLLLNLIAKERTVVAFDNKGVASSEGATPETYGAMADDAADFVASLGYMKVDVLGFSIGGAIAQQLLFKHSGLLRKCVLAASMPPGGKGILQSRPEVAAVATKALVELKDFLILFFEDSPLSQRAGREYLQRRSARTIDVEPPTTDQTMEAQGKARKAWAAMDVAQGVTDLKSVAQPVFVANGSNDVMISNPYSFSLYQSLPNAQLILYPDSGHGFLFQYPELFAAHLSIFLNGVAP